MKKNPWPIALTVLIAGAFLYASYIAFTMIRQKVDLVRPDYYEQDLRHGEQMAAERRAQALVRPVAVEPTADRRVAVTLPDPAVTGTITLFRPSDSKLDRALPLAPDAEGRQIVPDIPLLAGLWRVQVDWMQAGERYYHEARVVIP